MYTTSSDSTRWQLLDTYLKKGKATVVDILAADNITSNNLIQKRSETSGGGTPDAPGRSPNTFVQRYPMANVLEAPSIDGLNVFLLQELQSPRRFTPLLSSVRYVISWDTLTKQALRKRLVSLERKGLVIRRQISRGRYEFQSTAAGKKALSKALSFFLSIADA